MANAQLKNVMLIASVLVTIMFVTQGYKASNILSEKTKLQDAETDTVVRWKQSYQALAGSREKWDRSFRRDESVQDMVALTGHLGLANYGLSTDSDNMVLTKVEPVLEAGQQIGLTKICLATGASSNGSLVLSAQTYEALLTGIDKLSKRLDINMGNISLQGDKAQPVAALGDFCVLLRN